MIEIFPLKDPNVDTVRVYFSDVEISMLLDGEVIEREKFNEALASGFSDGLNDMDNIEDFEGLLISSVKTKTGDRKDFALSGNVVAEFLNEEGDVLGIEAGPWRTSVRELCSEQSLNSLKNETLELKEIIRGLVSGEIDGKTVSLPDLLIAGEDVSGVELTFTKKGKIVDVKAEVDDLSFLFSIK